MAYFSILEAYLDFSPRVTLESAKKWETKKDILRQFTTGCYKRRQKTTFFDIKRLKNRYKLRQIARVSTRKL